MRLYKFLCLTVGLIGISVATNAQDQNFNLNLLSNWDIDTMPNAGSVVYNDCWGYVDCSGGEYAVMGSASYTHFFDLSDPTAPAEINYFAGGNTTIWRDYKSYKNYIYGVCDSCTEGLQVFDMNTAPDSVVRVLQTDEFFGKSHNIFLDTLNAKLYCPGTNTQSNGLVILDLSETPENPTLLSSIELPGGYVHDLYVRNDTAFCSHGFNGLYVYDMADPLNPVTLGIINDYPQSGYNHSSWLSVDGNHLIMADETHNTALKIINTEDLGDMEVTDLFRSNLLAPNDTASIVHNPFVLGDLVFLSYYHDGVQVYDFSDPTNAVKVASYDTETGNTDYAGFKGCWGVYPYLPSGTIIASDVQNGLFLFETENLNLDPVSANATPVVSINPTGTVEICEDEVLDISIEGAAEQVDWYFNEELTASGDELSISDQGTLYAVASNGHCTGTTESIEIIEIVVPISTPAFNLEEAYCPGDSVLLEVEENYETYAWFIDGELVEGNTANSLVISESGQVSYDYGIGNCTETSDNYELIFEESPTMMITVDGYNLTAPSAGVSFQWYFNGTVIDAAIEQTYFAAQTGDYSVQFTTTAGCDYLSEITNVVNAINNVEHVDIKLYPNPVDLDKILLSNDTFDNMPYEIIDLTGKIHSKGIIQDREIQLNKESPGIYILQIKDGQILYSSRFTKI